MLFNPVVATYAEFWLNPFKAAAAAFGVDAIAAPVRDKAELESVVATQARAPNSGFVVMPDSFTDAHSAEITSLAARYRLPAVYAYRFFTAAGGLMSYGVELIDNFPRAATYVDRILKGEKPADLPVQAPAKYRADDQPQDREGARPRRTFVIPAARRRTDRLRMVFAAVHEFLVGTSPTCCCPP